MHMECQYFFIFVFLFSCLNILPRTPCHAAATADAFAFTYLCLAEFQVDGAVVLADVAFGRAVFFMTLQGCTGDLRKQGENSSHRAQKLAEKALLHGHADDDHAKQDECRDISVPAEIPGCQQRKDSPRTVLRYDTSFLHKT